MAFPRLIVVGELSDPVRNNFDALRLAMALFVIWSHSFAIHLGSERSEWLSLLLHGVYNAGNIAVMAFFIISGFLITQSYERSRSSLSYFEKRIRRIYPGYMVATTISAFFFLHFFAPGADTTGEAWPKTLAMNLLLRNYSPVPPPGGNSDGGLLAINGALWSIPYEFWCYIGVAVLGSVLLLRHRWFVFSSLTCVMIAHIILDYYGKTPGFGLIGVIIGWPYLWTKMAPCFMLGMLAYQFRDQLPRSPALLMILLVGSVIACWVSPSLGFLVALPSLAYAIFYIAFCDGIPLQNAAVFGDFSYGTYLYGYLIQKILQFTVARTWGLAEFFLASAALSLLAGALSWHLVEKWFLPRRRASRAVEATNGKSLLASDILPVSGSGKAVDL